MKKGNNAILAIGALATALIVLLVYLFVPTVKGLAYRVSFFFSMFAVLFVFAGIFASNLLVGRSGKKGMNSTARILLVYGILVLALSAYFAFWLQDRGVLLLVLLILLTVLYAFLAFFSMWISKNTPTIRTERWDRENPMLHLIERVGELRENPEHELFYPQLARIYDRLLFLDTTVVRDQDELLELTLRELEVQMQEKGESREALVEEKTNELIRILREREDELRKLRAESYRGDR